jgi:hypothetical protein
VLCVNIFIPCMIAKGIFLTQKCFFVLDFCFTVETCRHCGYGPSATRGYLTFHSREVEVLGADKLVCLQFCSFDVTLSDLSLDFLVVLLSDQ